ncbi:LOW QUALITY PROTEIN: midnolin [Lates calcarifer]|uniref:LOW QUALITY PROTEIN: midnolin n=1 Tax=Lates calcarifer TaxID=8187 RepID=A0AAJ7LIJ5_LATCA|nr:LOW QUALITY PROTEIN: midnolin [Lates calcarifer]
MPNLGEQTGTQQTFARSFRVFATIIGYRMDQHPSARSCTSRGASSCEAVPTEPSMNLYIHSTTGTRFELSLPLEETVEGLKRRLSQRLKVPKERLALLHKETRLSSGKLQDLGISDGSKLTLVPTVEAGLMSQASRPEQSVMQALESLTETQVSDFLSGRSPLTLALRVGDHMMFVQLQLAAQQSGGPQLQHRHLITRGNAETAMGQPAGQPRVPHPHPHPHSHHHHPHHPHSHPGPHLSQPHPVPSSPSSPGSPSFPLPSTHHQPLPPMYHQSPSSAHCSPPTPPPQPHSPRPSHIPGGLFRSPAHHHHHHYHQPSSGQPSHDISQASPVAPVLCPEANCSTSSPTSGTSPPARSRKPGAIIESFVNHAPGVFSGTFSGTLHPNCQDSNGRPRRDIGTILQILNDLLSATRHYQGMPPSLTQLRYQTQCGSPTSPSPSPPPSPPVAGMTGLSAKATSVPASSPSSPPPTLHPLVQCQSQIRMCKPPGDRIRQTENRATRCKVERLQLLMQQKRLRRKARRDQRAPYQWLPNRKAGRSNSNSSMSSEGSLDLDFDDSVWKPDVKADLKSEFVMA